MKVIQGKQAVVTQIGTTAAQESPAAVMQIGTTAAQGCPAVVTQIRTTTAAQGKPVRAVCHGVSAPVYQKLHYHSVQPVAEQEIFPVIPDGKPAENTGDNVPELAKVWEADTAEPAIREKHLESVPKEMTLQELFQREKE